MNTLLVILTVAALGFVSYKIIDWLDRGSVNSGADLPTKKMHNNLDWAEDEYKWDARKPITDDAPLLFDIDEEFAVRIRKGVKKR